MLRRPKAPAGSGSRRLIKGVMAMLWSSALIGGALATAHSPGLTVSFWRFASATPLMALIALASRVRWPQRGEIVWVVAAGVLLNGVQIAGVYTALGEGAPAGLVALMVGSSPVLVAMVGALFFQERLAGRQWLGSALGIAGVVCAVADEIHGAVTALSLLLALIGLLGLTTGTLIQRHHPWRADPRSALTVQLVAVTVFFIPLAAVGPGFHVDLDYQSVAPIVWLLVPTIGGTLLFFWLLKREQGGEATSFLYLVPSITAIAAVPILGEPLGTGVILGLALSVIGLNLVGRADRYEPDPVGGEAPDPSPGQRPAEGLRR